MSPQVQCRTTTAHATLEGSHTGSPVVEDPGLWSPKIAHPGRVPEFLDLRALLAGDGIDFE
ncbi:MAG: hypothetical protein ABL962_15590 [Fimbriimonadaceae bacterium]